MPATKRAAAAAAAASKRKQKTDHESSEESENEEEFQEPKQVPPESDDLKSDGYLFVHKKKEASPNTVGRKTKKSNEIQEAIESVSVIIVDPSEITGDRATGLVIIPKGFMMDKFMSAPFYLSRNDPVKIEYLELLGCVPWVMNGAKDKSGNLISKTINDKHLPIKAMVILTDGVPEDDEIVKLVNETVAPAIWNSYLRDSYSVRKGRGEEKNLPKMIGEGRDHMWRVDTWSDALYVPEEALRIGDSMGEGGLHDWLRRDSNHLYQLYEEGTVPVHQFVEKNLPVECLRPLDRRNYNNLSGDFGHGLKMQVQ